MLAAIEQFDLMVVEGWDPSHDAYLQRLAPHGIVFLEGDPRTAAAGD